MLRDIIYQGKEIDDWDTYDILPDYLKDFYKGQNGIIAFYGGLHIRGCVMTPEWHSLNRVWFGELKISELYDCITKNDIPFAQDCFGDQYLIRNDKIIRLLSETGDLEFLEIGFQDFLIQIINRPNEFLNIENIERFNLKPGELLNVIPPFCINSNKEISFKAISTEERIQFLSDLAKQIKDLPDGTSIEFKVE